MRRYLFKIVLVSLIIFFQCSLNHLKEKSTAKVNNNFMGEFLISKCSIEDFTESEAEHIINEIKKPFIVREVKGKILNSDDDYGWSENIRVLFEIRRQGENSDVNRVFADANGEFRMVNIPEGNYCFKATVSGWQSVMGIIIVTKKANPMNKIVFKMRLGV